jgi:chromosomal replication initiation ATPase DnaA
MTGQQVMARLRERDGDGELLAIVKRIAAAHDVTVDELLGPSREAAPAHARQALWATLHERGHWSYPRLGKTFGRDHTTIIAGVNAHRDRMGLPRLVHKPGATYQPPGEAYLPQEVP